jgi:hypothetical protein
MTEWKLVAASGRDQLSGKFIQQTTNRSGATVICTDLVIRGAFWPRLKLQSNEYVEPVLDYSVALPQVVFEWGAVDELISELGEWLDSPKKISIELCQKAQGDQSFIISFGAIEELISSVQKPACTILYSGTVFNRGKWSFVVDQSCIRIFHEELRTAFNSLSSREEAR